MSDDRAAGWWPNDGFAPIFEPTEHEQEAPPNLIHEDEAANTRVQVELRNGRKPAGSWPLLRPTRWSLTGDPFDIVAWRRA